MKEEIQRILYSLERDGRFGQERYYTQHVSSTVYDHSLSVAEYSLKIAEYLNINVDKTSLIRGALLHDFFLYDWKKEQMSGLKHGITHPKAALENTKKDYQLNRIEENIILRHMFPLTPIPPTCKEAWIVSAADKYCAAKEAMDAWSNHLADRIIRLFLRVGISL